MTLGHPHFSSVYPDFSIFKKKSIKCVRQFDPFTRFSWKIIKPTNIVFVMQNYQLSSPRTRFAYSCKTCHDRAREYRKRIIYLFQSQALADSSIEEPRAPSQQNDKVEETVSKNYAPPLDRACRLHRL